MVIRNLVPEDISALLRLQNEAYVPELLDTERAILRKIEVFPRGCLCCEEGGQIHAYVISHPWRGEKEVEIDNYELAVPDSPDSYYLHDVVVEPEYRGRGLASSLVKQLFAVVTEIGLSKVVLVAVQSSEGFWGHFGFQPVRKLSYGLNAPATFMRGAVNDVSID